MAPMGTRAHKVTRSADTSRPPATMSAMLRLEQPNAEQRRHVLGYLPRKPLQRLVDVYDLEIADRRKRALYVEALIEADIDFFILLGILGHEELRQLAGALEVDSAGKEKQELIGGILSVAGSAGAAPALSEVPAPPAGSAGAAPASARAGKKRKQKKKRPTTPERSDHAELLRQLWEAVELRGSIEPADYKRYVLPIIFLRFLSVRFEQRRVELADEIREPSSPYYAESQEEEAFILDDEDSYRSANVFPVPKAARWEEIRKHAQADDIKIRLDRALEALEDAYPLKLKGLLYRQAHLSITSAEEFLALWPTASREGTRAVAGVQLLRQGPRRFFKISLA